MPLAREDRRRLPARTTPHARKSVSRGARRARFRYIAAVAEWQGGEEELPSGVAAGGNSLVGYRRSMGFGERKDLEPFEARFAAPVPEVRAREIDTVAQLHTHFQQT